MTYARQTLLGLMLVLSVGLMPAKSQAVDFEVQTIFEDAIYGGGIGAAVGLGVMLLTDKPSDNLDFILRGVGVGIIAGAAYGILVTTDAFAEVNDGKVKIALPTPVIRPAPAGQDLAMTIGLFRTRF